MSNRIVYDKAKYHFDGNFPDDLHIEQAYVHTGMYLGWIIENNLLSEEFRNESKDEISQFKDRKMSGTQIYISWDGALVDDMLSDEGNEFSTYYFDFEKGQYLHDYEELLAKELVSLYHVKDSWENYVAIKSKIDERYKKWKRSKKHWFRKFF